MIPLASITSATALSMLGASVGVPLQHFLTVLAILTGAGVLFSLVTTRIILSVFLRD